MTPESALLRAKAEGVLMHKAMPVAAEAWAEDVLKTLDVAKDYVTHDEAGTNTTRAVATGAKPARPDFSSEESVR